MSKRKEQRTRRVALTTHDTADLPALILERHIRLGDVDDDLAATLPLFRATHISNWEWRGIHEIAERRGVSMSRVIRAAIDAELAKEGIQRPPPSRPHVVKIEIDGEPANVGLLHRIAHTLRGQD